MAKEPFKLPDLPSQTNPPNLTELRAKLARLQAERDAARIANAENN